MSLPIYYRILYIDSEVDEKEACLQLEAATYSLKDYDSIAAFTVVPNIFSALEYLNRMKFDLIIIDASVSNFTVALSEIDMSIPTFLSVAFKDSLHLDMELIKKKGFKGIMVKPFSSEQLSVQIKNALNIDNNDIWTENTSARLLQMISNDGHASRTRETSSQLSEKSEILLRLLEDFAS